MSATMSNHASSCRNCGTVGDGLKMCSRCHDAHYCSKECSQLDYLAHKASCKTTAVAVADRYHLQAESGDAAAAYNYAMRCLLGFGVRKNPELAVHWLRKSASGGSGLAAWALGNHYDDGIGVPRDEVQRFLWWRVAAGRGHTQAQFNVGLSHHKGRGTHVDLRQALHWYSLAALANHQKAIINKSGLMLQMGMEEDEGAHTAAPLA